MKMNQQHRVLANRDGAARVRNAIVHADDTVALVLVLVRLTHCAIRKKGCNLKTGLTFDCFPLHIKKSCPTDDQAPEGESAGNTRVLKSGAGQ